VVPAALLAWRLGTSEDSARAWKGIVAEHLRLHLMVGGENRSRVQPVHLLCGGWIVAILALAGPSWRREPAPFADDTAALAIVLKVTPSMRAEDIQPDRLTRSVQKIRDLLKHRPGARTALIAYAGSAHRVLPLTRDSDLVSSYAGDLSPDVMPIEGDVCGEALQLAQDQIVRSGQAGWILWICDGVSPDQRLALTNSRQPGRAPITVLAATGVGPELASLREAAETIDSTVVTLSADDRDVRQLAANTRFSPATVAGASALWQDAGYWLVPPLALLSLGWFRPGWMVRTAAGGSSR
jgi:Ca-activated chloride channel family protein